MGKFMGRVRGWLKEFISNFIYIWKMSEGEGKIEKKEKGCPYGLICVMVLILSEITMILALKFLRDLGLMIP